MRIVDFGLYSGSSQQRVMIEWIVSFITATTDCAARLHSVTV
jgi:hypothetical protein